ASADCGSKVQIYTNIFVNCRFIKKNIKNHLLSLKKGDFRPLFSLLSHSLLRPAFVLQHNWTTQR
ncbi:MAG: hypothetical protein KIG52_05590, partial [Muribaculaceae bacterium]|nr:hypothetical protein [Muribaculaceae bacterium]